MSTVPNFLISAAAIRSTRVRVVALFAILLLALLSGCASSNANPTSGGNAAWSTGGNSPAHADPVPSAPAPSSETPQRAQDVQESENHARVSPEASVQDDEKPAGDGADGSDSSPSTADPQMTGEAQSALAGLAVRSKERRTGYDPQLFDSSSDADDNGCDTRNDVLRRDLKDLVVQAGTQGCTVAAGHFDDEYLGESYDFERGSTKIEIDNVVSLSNAWQTGASDLSVAQLREFGNDPLNLLAVSSRLKRQKAEGDAAAWLPPNEDYQCEYVSRQIAVKQKYGLWVAAAEKDAMETVLETCADQSTFNEDVNWPQPGEGDDVTTESDAEPSQSESSGEPSEEASEDPSGEASSEPTEEASTDPSGKSTPGDSSNEPETEPATEPGADNHAGES